MVSVCMATYNGASFVEQQLRSILSQLGENDEVIVSDDQSTDSTLDIINALADKRITILQNSARVGVIKNFERALQHARGDVVFLSDQDDIWLSGKLQTCLKALETADLVMHNFRFSTSPDTDFFTLRNTRKGVLRNIYKNSYTGCCMAFRRSILDWALPFPRHIAMHDQWIGLLAEIKGKVSLTNETLLEYRLHEANLSFNGSKTTIPFLTQLSNRLWISLYLAERILKLALSPAKPCQA